MLVNFETAGVDRVSDSKEIDSYLEALEHGTLPGFVLSRQAAESHPVETKIEPVLVQRGYGIPKCYFHIVIGAAEGDIITGKSEDQIRSDNDAGLHIGHYDKKPGFNHLTINHILLGEVAVTLFEFIGDPKDLRAIKDSVGEANAAYQAGQVDDSFMNPKGFRTVVDEGEVLVHDGNLFHDYASLTIPRASDSYAAFRLLTT